MHEQSQPTAYDDVNVVLAELLAQVQAALGVHFVGMYLSGSLALGDFDPNTSDFDCIVVTDDLLADEFLAALRKLHTRFAQGDSLWTKKLEVIYIARNALRDPMLYALNTTLYPQVEAERGFFLEPLEEGWLSHCLIVREQGVVLAGPNPQTLIDPVDPNVLRRAVAKIPAMWQNDAATDPSWLEWLRTRKNQAFVILTLCRLLYTLELGGVASKPRAARWAQHQLGARWAGLIERALVRGQDDSVTPAQDVVETVALVEFTVESFRRWETSLA